MSATEVQPMLEPLVSEVVLTVRTQNSIYKLRIGRFSTSLTCTKGTFAGEVTEANSRPELIDLERRQAVRLNEAWRLAAGGRLKDANALVEDRFLGRKVAFLLPEGDKTRTVSTTAVQALFWGYY